MCVLPLYTHMRAQRSSQNTLKTTKCISPSLVKVHSRKKQMHILFWRDAASCLSFVPYKYTTCFPYSALTSPLQDQGITGHPGRSLQKITWQKQQNCQKDHSPPEKLVCFTLQCYPIIVTKALWEKVRRLEPQKQPVKSRMQALQKKPSLKHTPITHLGFTRKGRYLAVLCR